MKIIDTLIQIYPVSDATLNRVALERGIDVTAEATAEILNSKEYKLAEADIQISVSNAPNLGQSGITFNLSDKMRESLKKEANMVYKEFGDAKYSGVTYGYKGSRL